MSDQVFLAVDLGASGGRVVAGLFDGARLRLEEVARFDNGPVRVQGHLYWDLLGLWQHLQAGLRAAHAKYGSQIASVGVDTWGVDYGLLGTDGTLLGNPYCYRDSRTEGQLDKTLQTVSKAEIFEQTGIQFMQINTLYQLHAMRLQQAPLLDLAERFLMMPDLFHWLLTGQAVNEYTNATTTQCFDVRKRNWASPLLAKLQIPTHLFGDPVAPGTRLGKLLPAVAQETGLRDVDVVIPPAHDTASAVVAVPAAARPGALPNWAYLCTGTWSLLGVEWPEPVITPDSLALGFTNEGGIEGTTRLLKNITGLWVVQECRRIWSRQGQHYSWEQLTELASAAAPLVSLIDPDLHDFQAPADMPAAIQAFCARTGQRVPEGPGAIIRCALESLALKQRVTLDKLERLIGTRLELVHVVGGGAHNKLLCQFSAEAFGRPVIAGPEEATATGNLLVQAIANVSIASLAQARQVVRDSFETCRYEPRQANAWEAAYQRFLPLTQLAP